MICFQLKCLKRLRTFSGSRVIAKLVPTCRYLSASAVPKEFCANHLENYQAQFTWYFVFYPFWANFGDLQEKFSCGCFSFFERFFGFDGLQGLLINTVTIYTVQH